MGADSLDYFDTWKYPEIICEKAIILVAVRDDMDFGDIQTKILEIQSNFSACIYPLSCNKVDISSSIIRRDLKKGILHEEFLPAAVAEYIKTNHMYQ